MCVVLDASIIFRLAPQENFEHFILRKNIEAPFGVAR